mmetsp:Transcript_18728/g.47081  ORF Transcript_18728/g.47081 Transcript_18728/m.47081 type:complete len:194 (-) Transcript_18728:937-1518(-)
MGVVRDEARFAMLFAVVCVAYPCVQILNGLGESAGEMPWFREMISILRFIYRECHKLHSSPDRAASEYIAASYTIFVLENVQEVSVGAFSEGDGDFFSPRTAASGVAISPELNGGLIDEPALLQVVLPEIEELRRRFLLMASQSYVNPKIIAARRINPSRQTSTPDAASSHFQKKLRGTLSSSFLLFSLCPQL